MTDSPANNEHEDADDRLLEEFLRPGSGVLATRVTGFNLIDVGDVGHFPTLSPHRKALLCFLLLCLKDRATELRFEPRDTDLGAPEGRVSYVVNGEIYELVPPPFEISIEIVQEIKELASLVTLPGRMSGIWRAVADRIVKRSTGSTYGGFRIGAEKHVSEVTVIVQPSSRGDRILMQISAIDRTVARIAEENLRGLFENRRNAGREDSAEGPSTA